MTGAVALDEVAEHFAVVRNDIEIELGDVGGRRSRDRFLAFRYQAISHVEPSYERRQGPARMVKNDSQLRVSLEYASVDQQSRGKPGVVQVADQIAEKISGQR